MADQLQLRGGTTAEHSTFTGALREVTVDTDKDTVVVHDGSTAGGHPLAKQNLSNVPAGTITSTMIADGTIVNADINASAAIDKTKISGTAITAGDTGTVTSTMIADGTIVNADVNASAAIAGTKISPDFGSQTIQTTGVVSHALGTAAAPTLTFTGDTNTGIYCPGADQVAISTNGTGRLFIDSSGRVGVGGTANAARLASFSADVGGSIGDTAQIVSVNTNGGIGDFSGIRFNYYNDGNTGGKFAYIGSVLTSTTSNGAADIVFGTRPTSTTTISERLRITSDGKVGVGTSSPGAQLDVVSSGTPVKINRTGGGTAHIYLFKDGNAGGLIGSTGAGDVCLFDSNGNEYVRMTNAGRLGVGTTTPGATLDCNGSIRAISASPVIPSSGAGLEIYYASGTFNGTPSAYLLSYDRTGTVYKPINIDASEQVFRTSGSEKMRLTSTGLGIGSSSPASKLTVAGTQGNFRVDPDSVSSEVQLLTTVPDNSGFRNYRIRSNQLFLETSGSTALTIDTSQRVGIGTTSPDNKLHIFAGDSSGSSHASAQLTIENSGNSALQFLAGTSSSSEIRFGDSGDNGAGSIAYVHSDNSLRFGTNNGTEKARIDSSGRLLIGTSTSTSVSFYTAKTQIANAENANLSLHGYSTYTQYGADIIFTRSRSGSIGTNTIVQNGDQLARLFFAGANGTGYDIAAFIGADVDGVPGASGDMPGRLVFSTTADGASSPTERMRISSSGELFFNTTTVNPGFGNTATGIYFGAANYIHISRSDQTPFLVNRNTSDGTLVDFRQDGTQEGTISVSGTTVSYNGAHLSRWSQLPSGVERTEILRGSVLSNIDEMCEWGDEENEQLNRMKVSDVEGDKNVSGVFQAWDDDDDTYTNDFYCAMTGDFIIRIAAGITVERGDLLMSAGDGTAKPQDDDIIRSKTIAKVTSTNVSCTYDDGSYCVPCVLMAC